MSVSRFGTLKKRRGGGGGRGEGGRGLTRAELHEDVHVVLALVALVDVNHVDGSAHEPHDVDFLLEPPHVLDRLERGLADDLDGEVVPAEEAGVLARGDLVRGREGALAEELGDLVLLVKGALETELDLRGVDLDLLGSLGREVVGENVRGEPVVLAPLLRGAAEEGTLGALALSFSHLAARSFL